jgi:hypothetical protein
MIPVLSARTVRVGPVVLRTRQSCISVAPQSDMPPSLPCIRSINESPPPLPAASLPHRHTELTLLAPPQVLRALADPSHPDLAANLRAAAAAITRKKRHELRLWLEGGLFTHLLDILRGLPAQGLPPNQAADICAAAAACVCNVVHCSQIGDMALPPRVTPGSLLDEADCVELLASVVHCGVVNTAAAGQLPAGQEASMLFKDNILAARRAPGDDEFRKESFGRLFNTPRTPCIQLLLSVTGDAAACALPDPCMKPALRRLLDGRIFEHMLQMAIHAPLQSKCAP